MMDDEDAQAIWQEIQELREELRGLMFDRKALTEQSQELLQLGEQLRDSANKAIETAEAVHGIAEGNGNGNGTHAPVEDNDE